MGNTNSAILHILSKNSFYRKSSEEKQELYSHVAENQTFLSFQGIFHPSSCSFREKVTFVKH